METDAGRPNALWNAPVECRAPLAESLRPTRENSALEIRRGSRAASSRPSVNRPSVNRPSVNRPCVNRPCGQPALALSVAFGLLRGIEATGRGAPNPRKTHQGPTIKQLKPPQPVPAPVPRAVPVLPARQVHRGGFDAKTDLVARDAHHRYYNRLAQSNSLTFPP